MEVGIARFRGLRRFGLAKVGASAFRAGLAAAFGATTTADPNSEEADATATAIAMGFGARLALRITPFIGLRFRGSALAGRTIALNIVFDVGPKIYIGGAASDFASQLTK